MFNYFLSLWYLAGNMFLRYSFLLTLAYGKPDNSLSTINGLNCPKSERRAWRDMTCSQQDAFLSAVTALKTSGVYDDFVTVHAQNSGAKHGSPEFLPWHRWYIYKFEQALQEVANDCSITLPYWDWERDVDESQTTVLHSETFGSFGGTNIGLFDHCCNDGIAASFTTTVMTNNCLERTFNNLIYSFSGKSQVLAYITNYVQYGSSSRSGCNGFRCALEGTPHAAPHNWVGDHMASMHSPDDPLFFLHHAQIDRIWALWQDYRGHDELVFAAGSYSIPAQYEGGKLNVNMPYDCAGCLFDFTLDGTNWPKAWEMISNQEHAKVVYKNDHLAKLLVAALGGVSAWNNPNWIEIATENVPIKCDRGDSSSNGFPLPIPSIGGLRGLQHIFDDSLSCPYIPFTDPSLVTKLNKLCQILPAAPVAELLAALADVDCIGKGNPISASPAWIAMTNLPEVVFECFHYPDAI